MPITVSGVASGLDTNGIVSQLLALEQRPVQLLQAQIARHTQRLTAVTALGGNVGSVGAGAARITDDLFTKSKITGGDGSIVTATDDGDAAPGTYQVEVKQLARAHRLASDGFANKDSTGVAGASGTLRWKVGPTGATKSVSVDTSTTLQDLADLVNGLSGGGVTASIINDATGTNPFRLVLMSSTTGTSSNITIVQNDTNLDLTNKQIDTAEVNPANSGTYTGTVTSSGTYTGTANKTYLLDVITAGEAGTARYRYSTDGGLTFNDNGGAGYVAAVAATAIGGNTEGVNIAFSNNGSSMSVGDRFSVDVFNPQLQTSQDAITVVDGITAVTQTNSVTDVIGGVTLNLVKAEAGTTVGITIKKDYEKLIGELNGMVVSLNNVAKFVNQQSDYDPETNTAGILSGDAAVRGLYRTMRSLLVRTVPALSGQAYDSLVALGLTSSSSGAYSLDKAKLQAALDDDPTAVRQLIKDFADASTSKIQYKSQTAATKAGSYAVKVVSDGAGGKTLTIGGHSVELNADVAVGAEGTPIEGLAIEVEDLQSQAIGDLGTLTVSKGIIDDLARGIQEMTNTETGIIKGKTDAINSQIETLKDQIKGHERRLVLVEQRLRRQFTDLEILMGRLQSQQNFITQQIEQFNRQK